MAGGKLTGPEGSQAYGTVIDRGTLARTQSSFPGPVSLYGHHPGWLYGKPQVPGKSPAATAAPALGIRVHDNSTIKAADWVAKIKACNDVPDYFKDQIKSANQLIFVTNPKHFVFPNNVIQKDWLDDWLSAFAVTEWEMTTGILEVKVERPQNPASKDPKLNMPSIEGVVKPDLANAETIDGFTGWAALTQKSNSAAKFAVEFGSTVPDGIKLQSGKKTIVITAQVNLILGGKPGGSFTVTDDELVNTWFHEIACHAGRNTQGKPDFHGNDEVDAAAKDINEMIPKRETVDKLFDAIQAFLAAAQAPAQQPGQQKAPPPGGNHAKP